jgi:hypothetical protein
MRDETRGWCVLRVCNELRDAPAVERLHVARRVHEARRAILDDLLKDDIEFKIYFQGSHMKF